MQSSSVQSFFPLVSVIIPAYNAETYLTRTLQSVLTQNYQNLEVIVIDDGSEDNTCHIVELIAKTDPRVILLRQGNAGVASARNHGIQRAKGEFVAPIDADDIWYPEAMAKLVDQFQANDTKLGVVYAWSIDIDEREQPTGGFHAAAIHGNVYKTLICHNFLGNASSTLIRTSCLEQVGGYDTQLKAQQAQGCEDWDLYLRLAEHYTFRGVPEFLIGYRNIPTTMSGDLRQMARSQQLMLENVEQRHPNIPRFLYRLSRSSYYLYLAHQSHANSNAKQTLYWLWQAIQIDPITPIGRLGFYRLLIAALIQRLGQQVSTSIDPPPEPLERAGPSLMNLDVSHDRLDRPIHLPIHRFQIWLKLCIGRLLHQSLLII